MNENEVVNTNIPEEREDDAIEVDTNVDTNSEVVGVNMDTGEEIKEEQQPVDPINPEDPLDDISMENIRELIKQVGESVKLMQEIWMTTQREFSLTKDIMQKLQKYNSDHITPLPEDCTNEDDDKWDKFNGIDHITEEEVEEIFGKDHNIIGVSHDVTISRIKECMGDLYSYNYAVREYNSVYTAYMQLQEEEEEKRIAQLREIADNQEDREIQDKMYKEIDMYYYRKRLKFLADPDVIDENTKKRIATGLRDEKKIDYWMHRTKDKLKRMGVSETAIMQIWNFEKRYLDEKYHKIDNALESFFLSTCTYCKPDEKDDRARNFVVCIVFAVDHIMRHIMPEDVKKEVMDNIIAFEESILKYMNE